MAFLFGTAFAYPLLIMKRRKEVIKMISVKIQFVLAMIGAAFFTGILMSV